MEYRIDDHAADQMRARRISRQMLDAVMQTPGQIVPGKKGRQVYQSLQRLHGKDFVLRAFVETRLRPALVISVYLTDNVRKYWQEEQIDVPQEDAGGKG